MISEGSKPNDIDASDVGTPSETSVVSLEIEEAEEDGELLAMLLEIEARCSRAGLPCERVPDPQAESTFSLRIQFPSGRGQRTVAIANETRAKLLRSTDFESVRFLGDYDAIVDTNDETIEARVLVRLPELRRLQSLQAGLLRSSVEGLEGDGEAEDADSFRSSRPIQLRLSRSGVELELSDASAKIRSMTRPPVTRGVSLKVRGAEARTQDAAISILETLANGFFFDLDIRYQAHLTLVRYHRPGPRVRVAPSLQPPEFPRNKYAAEPLALYTYGRSATGLPLLEFLAYYQVLEYFFPVFTREQLVRQVRRTLRNPAFDINDDLAISRLISDVSPSSRGSLSEREQLRATLRACASVSLLRDFVASSSAVKAHFCDKAQAISGVSRLLLVNSSADLRDQVADRVYDLRCRVVHAKQEGGEAGVDLLLPSSKEAQSLQLDVQLVRLLAQQALVTAATTNGY